MVRGSLVKIFLHEGQRVALLGKPVYEQVVSDLWRAGAPGVTVFRGIEGIGPDGRMQRMASEYISDELPVILEVFADQRQMPAILDRAAEVVTPAHGTACVIEDVYDVKELAHGGERRGMGDAILKIYMKEEDEFESNPLYHAIVRALQDANVLWVTVNRALEGFGAEHVLHKANAFRFSEHAPVSVEAAVPHSLLDPVLDRLAPLLVHASGPALVLPGRLVGEPGRDA
ncbi:MAG: DUF190 domain-containing protein [Alicyclobacillus sp.]|nr:DUF190 domain-containing protein [Alicyclobacillus sp.]